jgi:hypothetical protein
MVLSRRLLLAAGVSIGGIVGIERAGFLANARDIDTFPALPTNPAFPKLPIGMNLAGIADWEPGFPFCNLMWGARPWLTRNLDGSGPFATKTIEHFTLDENGYPLEVPVILPGQGQPQAVFTIVPNCGSAGNYVLLHDGEGEFEGLGATTIVSAKRGRVILNMKHDGTLIEQLCIKRSKRGNHIRNIRILPVADEKIDLTAQPFRQEFLEFCKPFHCLRFMDWGSVNNNIEENWSDRKRPGFYTMIAQSGDPDGRWGPPPTPFQRLFAGGVAIEIMIQAANATGIDPWFCIPHRATDDYIANFAKLVREKLDPKLKVYIEYSNEIWNWGFKQAGWMLQSKLAGALVEAKGGKAWKDLSKTQGEGHPERIAALFRRAFAIWENEWRGPDRKRLIRVCTVQAAWFDASRRTLQWCIDNGGVDAISPSAYIGPDDKIYARWATLGSDLTPEQVISDLRAHISELRMHSGNKDIVLYAKQLGIPYVSYEAGQHIQPKGQADLPYNPALAAAQTHPAMYELYVDLIRFHRDLGCKMFGHYSSIGRQGTRWGSWGAKRSYSTLNSDSPKMRALLAYNAPKLRPVGS